MSFIMMTRQRMFLLAMLTVFPFSTPLRAQTGDRGDLFDSLEADAGHAVAIPLISRHPYPRTDLTRPPWDRATRLTGFFEIEGRRLASQPTWVHLFYDRSALWVGLRCEGRGKSDLRTEITERDAEVWRDDSVEVLVDPGHLHRDYYQFVINSAGVVYDASGEDKEWDARVVVRTAVDEQGWTALLRLPFSQRVCEKVSFCR